MKLLLDQNISKFLLTSLEDVFPSSTHVVHCGLETALDAEIWDSNLVVMIPKGVW